MLLQKYKDMKALDEARINNVVDIETLYEVLDQMY